MCFSKQTRFLLPVILLFIAVLFGFASQSWTQDWESLQELDETCLDCHDEIDLTLVGSPHRLSWQTEQPAIEVACVNCHPGGEVHAEDPEIENITNPARLSGAETEEICRNCHQPHKNLDNYGYDSHSLQQLNCADCHRVHGSSAALLLDDRSDFCLKCHDGVATGFQRRSQHPVQQEALTCLSCHKFTRKSDNNALYDFDRVCQDCHPQQAGPYLYEHPATEGYNVVGGGCVECHDPHGSQNDFLLRQPSRQLCRSCHVEHVTSNHDNLWSTVWSQYPCQSCHTGIHGSFHRSDLLDPNLPDNFSGDCFNSGCHGANGSGGN